MSDWPSISRLLKISDLEATPKTVSLDASAEDKEVLAKAFGLEDVAFLRGEMDVTRHGELVRVTGSITADLGRICVVSLEPMRELINEEFSVEYTTEAQKDQVEDDEGDLDAPEPLTGDVLDLADVLTEQLVLAMSAHPRRNEAEAPEDPGAGPGSSPFDILKGLKN